MRPSIGAKSPTLDSWEYARKVGQGILLLEFQIVQQKGGYAGQAGKSDNGGGQHSPFVGTGKESER